MSDDGEIVLGVDIGGTFTDFALLKRATGALYIGKRLTTPDDPGRAFLDGVDELCARAGVSHAQLSRISHATTLVTNAIIERKGCATGLLMTAGFRDVLVMGRESRYDHYDFRFERPDPIVPRSLTREVVERTAWNGAVLQTLDEESVRRAVRELAAQGVASIAVCLLHAYRNPAHEQAIRSLMAREFPRIDCTISSEVAPELREYERASTTVLNAYVRPDVKNYLSRLDQALAAKQFGKHVHVMLSNGGISSTAIAQEIPIQLIESGPAAGALAAARYAELLGIGHALAFDMGGTTAKLCCIENGRPCHANIFETARAQRFRRGSGLPVLIPVIELIEIGAGGGSIAHIDALGLLKVGPQSAGAAPGPACYGRGGTAPTVTDADLVLGYIDPARFLGGDMVLDRKAAENAIDRTIGAPLAKTTVDAAWGMFAVVNEAMVAAAKRYAAERAIDIRTFTLITFGGAAPIHAWRVAKILGIRRIVYPLGAGATSAVGLCIAEPVINLSRSYVGPLDVLDWSRVAAMFAEMETRAMAMLQDAGAQPQDITVDRSVDIRYKGQGYEIEVPIGGIDLACGDSIALLQQLTARFEQAYARQFGRALGISAMEAITWRVRAAGAKPPFNLSPQVAVAKDQPAQTASRRVYFGPEHGHADCPIFNRYLLKAGAKGVGPALLEERETTVVVGPGAQWAVDAYRNLLVDF
jgi:N-methylhydantoinase A